MLNVPMKYVVAIVMIPFMVIIKGRAQSFEPLTIRYQSISSTHVASADREAFEDQDRKYLNWVDVNVRYPLWLKNGGLILPEYGYKAFGQSFEQWPQVETEPLTAQLHRLSFKGVFPLNRKWNLLGIGVMSQGLNDGVGFNIDNNFYRFGVGFLINKDSVNLIGASVVFVSEVGLPIPVFIYKGASKSGKWLFNLEAPQLSIVEYNLVRNDTRIRFEQRLDNDRISFSSNVEDTADSYNYTHLNVSMGISQRLFGPVYANGSVGISPLNVLSLYDLDNEVIETIRFDIRPTFSFSLYVSVNPNDRK